MESSSVGTKKDIVCRNAESCFIIIEEGNYVDAANIIPLVVNIDPDNNTLVITFIRNSIWIENACHKIVLSLYDGNRPFFQGTDTTVRLGIRLRKWDNDAKNDEYCN